MFPLTRATHFGTGFLILEPPLDRVSEDLAFELLRSFLWPWRRRWRRRRRRKCRWQWRKAGLGGRFVGMLDPPARCPTSRERSPTKIDCGCWWLFCFWGGEVGGFGKVWGVLWGFRGVGVVLVEVWVWGFGFGGGVWGLGFGVWGLGLGVWGFGVWGLGFGAGLVGEASFHGSFIVSSIIGGLDWRFGGVELIPKPQTANECCPRILVEPLLLHRVVLPSQSGLNPTTRNWTPPYESTKGGFFQGGARHYEWMRRCNQDRESKHYKGTLSYEWIQTPLFTPGFPHQRRWRCPHREAPGRRGVMLLNGCVGREGKGGWGGV